MHVQDHYVLYTWLYKEIILFKGIFQPFELGGMTRLIQSAVKFCKAGRFKIFFLNDTIPREELKTN